MPLCLLGFQGGSGGGGEMDGDERRPIWNFEGGGPGGRSLVVVMGFVQLSFCGPLWAVIAFPFISVRISWPTVAQMCTNLYSLEMTFFKKNHGRT